MSEPFEPSENSVTLKSSPSKTVSSSASYSAVFISSKEASFCPSGIFTVLRPPDFLPFVETPLILSASIPAERISIITSITPITAVRPTFNAAKLSVPCSESAFILCSIIIRQTFSIPTAVKNGTTAVRSCIDFRAVHREAKQEIAA